MADFEIGDLVKAKKFGPMDYDLVPKKPAKAIIGMEEFRTLAHGKAPEWIKLFISFAMLATDATELLA